MKFDDDDIVLDWPIRLNRKSVAKRELSDLTFSPSLPFLCSISFDSLHSNLYYSVVIIFEPIHKS